MKNLVLVKLIKHLFSSQSEADKNLSHLSSFPTAKTKLSGKTKKESGFTIIELIVVVLCIGILSAIAAPAWNAFITRQRIRTVNGQVLQALQKAQLEAKKRKDNVEIKFNPLDPLEVEINGISQNFDPTGAIKPGMIELVVKECKPKPKDDKEDEKKEEYCTTYIADQDDSITFDDKGAVVTDDPSQELPFVVTVFRPNGSDGERRCVFVETILGGMRTDEGKFDPVTGRGCR